MFFPSSLARVDQLRLHADNRLVTVRKKRKKVVLVTLQVSRHLLTYGSLLILHPPFEQLAMTEIVNIKD